MAKILPGAGCTAHRDPHCYCSPHEAPAIEMHTPTPRPGALPGADLLKRIAATFDYLGEIATAAACMRGILRREMTALRSGARPESTQVILDRNEEYIRVIRHRAGLL